MRAPDGYLLVPVTAEQPPAPLRICALVKQKPDPVGGRLVVLRETLEARVFLGCVADAGGRVHRWLELWVQNLDNMEKTVAAARQALSNDVLDKRWAAHAAALASLDAPAIVVTGWEKTHPEPTLLDPEKAMAVRPPARDGGPWTLCQDDALLTGNGLPPFSTSLHRYLVQAQRAAESAFVAVTAEAPASPSVKSLDQILDNKNLLPLNPGAGLMLLRSYSPISYEGFVEVLGGAAWDGVLHGRSPVELDGAVAALKDSEPSLAADGRLFLGRHGRKGRLAETFHLKLRALADAVAAVRSLVAQVKRPLLNLTADSFQVRLGQTGTGLPFLWTAQVVLADPGDAVELPVTGSDAQYFLPGLAAGPSIYRPDSANGALGGRGSLRLRKTISEAGGAIIAEGTFVTQERLTPSRQDLLWLRLNLGGNRVDLYARMERETALAAGEWRIRTVPQRLGEAAAAQLKSAEGVPVPNVAFELLPLLSSPCDLYALAVLAVRTLVVDPRSTLPVALDELLSLARQAAAAHDEATPLPTRLRAIFDQDPRWVDSLGPQRLVHEALSAKEAFDLLPSDLWFEALALIVRMLPGIGPDSTARDLGDARALGLHKAFDRAAADLDALLVRTRSLIVIDWQYNRKVHAVIRQFQTGTQ